MRRIVGKRVVDLSAADLIALRKRYSATMLDVGTGDGKHVIRLAREHRDWLVIGVDANADRMRKASTRVAAKPARGGLPNVLFVWSTLEQLPAELTGIDVLHMLMPWGSLLRGAVGRDDTILRRIANSCRPGAAFLVTLNPHAWHPPVTEVGDCPEPDPEWAMGQLSERYRAAGLQLTEARYLSESEIVQLATSWTRRLGSHRGEFQVLALRGVVEPSTTRP